MPVSLPAVRRLILGTAGHIDHGKTALVKRLTGTDCDRLPEEKERGMTIDVGYAALTLPDGTELGLLDVPGHERLVRTMVAAATSMDLALLVVAADDGPMPQTREHVEILDVLGITRLVVALTKIDLVDEDTRFLAEEEVKEMLEPTGMAGAPIYRVSSETGEGIDALRDALVGAIPPADEAELHGARARVFRMPVLRSFLVKGRGAVVTGIPMTGHVKDGDKVVVLPHGWASRVRGVQVHHQPAEEAHAGQRTALALTDIHVDKVKRGMDIVTANTLEPTRRIAVRLRVLGDVKKPIAHTSRARLHVGADQHIVRIHLPAAKALGAGETAVVELEADKPFVTLPGDRFVLRQENAQATLGGGVVIELLERRLPRRRQGLLDTLLARVAQLDDPQSVVLGALEAAGDRGVAAKTIVALSGVRPEVVSHALEQSADAVRVGRSDTWIWKAAFEKTVDRLEAAVTKLHEKDKALDSLTLATVRSAMGRAEPNVLDAALDRLFEAGTLVRTPAGQVRHKDHSVDLPPEEKARCDAVLKVLGQRGGQPPDIDELGAITGLAKHELNRSLRLLGARGLAFKAGDHWFDGAWLDGIKEGLRTLAGQRGGFTPADARTLMNSSRKFVIPLLEALDKTGFSRRAGDKRVIK
ncbi:MAG: selenocysteine-specific translation elongation factor [Planctomycetota bacterium]|nr:selenocysteine-specific translation elongation factor [Planctomycetota bacterium]